VITKVRAIRGLQDCRTLTITGRYARTMSSQTVARPGRSATSNRKRKKAPRRGTGGTGWIAWWPLAAGVAITLVAVKVAEILPLMGPGGLLRLRLLYPWAMLLKEPLLNLSEPTSDRWSQLMLYAQWVLYGLYASVVMRWKPLWTVVMQVAAIHLLGFGVLWLLTQR
jgi:hypothetical protein